MGKVRMGIPRDNVEFIAKKLSLATFIEGGTYKGKTARYASKVFDNVLTIEMSEIMYAEASKNLADVENVKVLKGDTRIHIKKLTKKYDNTLYWLDSHWSGGNTYGESDECPLLEELQIIFKNQHNFAVLIDDARLFMSPPPLPHEIESWPTLREITDIIPKGYEIFIYEDVIYVLPKSSTKPFQVFIQNVDYEREEKLLRNKFPFNKLFGLITLLKNSF